mmetsp:Transcript_69639/g.194651  ORF Transcript_69639/g.194651 Transcript_69639/m.194651 type:complete len:301 (+) Transcript_69639:116-1018(+)
MVQHDVVELGHLWVYGDRNGSVHDDELDLAPGGIDAAVFGQEIGLMGVVLTRTRVYPSRHSQLVTGHLEELIGNVFRATSDQDPITPFETPYKQLFPQVFVRCNQDVARVLHDRITHQRVWPAGLGEALHKTGARLIDVPIGVGEYLERAPVHESLEGREHVIVFNELARQHGECRTKLVKEKKRASGVIPGHPKAVDRRRQRTGRNLARGALAPVAVVDGALANVFHGVQNALDIENMRLAATNGHDVIDLARLCKRSQLWRAFPTQELLDGVLDRRCLPKPAPRLNRNGAVLHQVILE